MFASLKLFMAPCHSQIGPIRNFLLGSTGRPADFASDLVREFLCPQISRHMTLFSINLCMIFAYCNTVHKSYYCIIQFKCIQYSKLGHLGAKEPPMEGLIGPIIGIACLSIRCNLKTI